MSSHWELLAVLREERETVSRLVQLESTERRAIAERDLAALKSVTLERSGLSRNLRDLEEQRREIARGLVAADGCLARSPRVLTLAYRSDSKRDQQPPDALRLAGRLAVGILSR